MATTQQLENAVKCKMRTKAGPRCTRSTTNPTRNCGQHNTTSTDSDLVPMADLSDGTFSDGVYANDILGLSDDDWADSLATIAAQYVEEEGYDTRDLDAYQDMALRHATNIVRNVSQSDLLTYLAQPRGNGDNAINYPQDYQIAREAFLWAAASEHSDEVNVCHAIVAHSDSTRAIDTSLIGSHAETDQLLVDKYRSDSYMLDEIIAHRGSNQEVRDNALSIRDELLRVEAYVPAA